MLDERTGLPSGDISHLLELCLRSTYFRFRGSSGLMVLQWGSQGLPVVANIYIEHFKALGKNGYLRHHQIHHQPQKKKTGETNVSRSIGSHHRHVEGMSETVWRVCKDYNIRIAFKSAHTMRQFLVKEKDAVPGEKRPGVVYEIPYGMMYEGQTGRSLVTRVKEHKVV